MILIYLDSHRVFSTYDDVGLVENVIRNRYPDFNPDRDFSRVTFTYKDKSFVGIRYYLMGSTIKVIVNSLSDKVILLNESKCSCRYWI